MATDQQDWVDHLELAEFYYKNSEHLTSSSTSFQMVTRKSPIVPTTWAALGQPQMMQMKKCQWSHNLMKKDGAYGRWRLWEMARANLEKAHKRYKDFSNKSQREVNFEEGDEVWLNIKNLWLLEGLSHKFLGPYAGPFKVLEKKIPNTYKLQLPNFLKIHPIFHVLLLKPITRDASRPNREHNSRPPPNLIHNELEFEMKVVLKLKQLRGQK